MKLTGLWGCLLSLSLVCGLKINAIAQTQISEFGAFTQEDFNLKECSFDKSADAVVLFDQATSNYNDEYNLVTDHRTRIKILKEKGIERGNIHIRFYSKDKFEFITRISGIVASPGPNGIVWTKLDPKTIFTRKINEIQSEVVFAMPDVKVGSIIEYQYESVMEHYGGLNDWYFQQEIPVLLSSYKLYILPNVAFNYLIKKSPFMDVTVKPDKVNGSILFEMKDIPGLRDEAYSTSYRDYLQKVNFQLSEVVHSTGATTRYSNDWKELARDLLDDKSFGTQINKNFSIPTTVSWSSNPDAYKKMQLIYNYVRQNFQWNDIYSIYATDGLKSVIDKKKGTTGELNLLLINLLKDAGLNAYPLLVSERWHGKVDTAYSFLDQFNKVVAVVYLDEKMYILDATNGITPASMIPPDLLNTTGFLVDKKNFGFVHLIDNTKSRMYRIDINGTVDAGGLVKARAGIDFYGYARIGKAKEYNSDKGKYVEQFSGPVSGLKVDSFDIQGTDNDTVQLHHDLLVEYPLGKSGNYYLLNCNLFTGFDKNPFIADYRFTDIDFGSKYLCVLHENFELPDQMTIDALPKDILLRTQDQGLQVVREVRKNNNTIEVNLRIEFKRILYSSNEYSILKDFFTRMIDVLNEPLVLKAK